MVGREEFELPDGRKVRMSDRVLEQDLDDHNDCAFCLGRAAAHRGEAAETNPFTPTEPGSVDCTRRCHDRSEPECATCCGEGHCEYCAGTGWNYPALSWRERPSTDQAR